jgi:hypothetical protein
MKLLRLASIAIVLLVLAWLPGCSDKPAPTAQPRAAKPEAKEPVLYTAKEAFSQLVGYARLWAPDALPVHLESEVNSESIGHEGKATVWRGMFASPSRRVVKSFVCSGSRLADAPPFGMSSGGVESAYTSNMANLVFEPFFLKTNSDKAFAVAQEHGGEKLLKKDPNQPVGYVLEWDRKHHAPLWYVVYGKSMTDAKGIGVINATTGSFLRAHK